MRPIWSHIAKCSNLDSIHLPSSSTCAPIAECNVLVFQCLVSTDSVAHIQSVGATLSGDKASAFSAHLLSLLSQQNAAQPPSLACSAETLSRARSALLQVVGGAGEGVAPEVSVRLFMKGV